MTILMDGHITVDDEGVARIAGSRIRVIDLVMERIANGWTAEQLHEQFPHLSLGQIYAALAFYYDHRPELDEQIRSDVDEVARMRAATDQSWLIDRLRKAGRLP